MSIRKGFSLSLAIGATLIAAAAFSFGYGQFMVSEAVSENKAVDAIFTEGMQLVQLTNEVLLYGQPRAVAQWRGQFDKTIRLSAQKNAVSDPAAAEFLGRIAGNLTDMRPLLESFVADGNEGSLGRVPAEISRILSSQLFRKASLLQTSLRELKDASEEELTRVHAASKRHMMLNFALFASLIGLFGFVISVKFRHFVLRPIQNLGIAIRHVNEGRHEERAPVIADDEIGIVCDAFNGLLDQQAKHRQELQFLAYHDVLTGLPNQLLVADRINNAMAYANRAETKVALLFLDLDNFKAINDSLGHPVGDGLLQQVAMRLTGCVRDTDTVGRKGGDEFIIVLPAVHDAEDIAALVHKLLETLAAPIEVASHDLSTSGSIGIAIYPDDSDDFDTLLKMADTALYQAKAAGRNTYRFFTEQMNEASSEYLRIRNGLRRAMDHGGEFVLYYQPQVRLATGTVVGAEALIRWRHPELGMVSPSRFIPVAEDSGLIVPIGRWVLREACRQLKAWQAAGLPPLVVAVNLSAVQFKRGDLERTIMDAIEESGIRPEFLELELTESILIQDTESVLTAVRRLKALGLRLSIDDFGTGYSSLAYLKRFNVDKLKIDQSFVRGLASNSDDLAIVQAIIKLAHSLGLSTVAEGVENEAALGQLRLHQCEEGQGYHFARPMPAADFEAYLTAQCEIKATDAGVPG